MRDNSEVINIIKNLMNKHNLSLSELARRTGMAKSTISRYLSESREFPFNKVDDFAKALKVTPEYLLGFENKDIHQQNNIVLKIIDEVSILSDDELKDILVYIKNTKSQQGK